MDYKKFKILIIGCGSVGKRHIGNLKRLGIKDLIICDIGTEALKEAARKFNISHAYQDYKMAVSENKDLDAALICSSTNLHIVQALFLAKQRINIFMEKPLSHNLEGINELIKVVNKHKLIFMMGMCYRFHPGLRIIKKLLDKRELGKIYSARCFGGDYLPGWRPDGYYEKGYAARKALGGGVVLTSIHGYDYIRWLFGEAKQLYSRTGKVSHLKINVEDIAVAIFDTDKGIIISSYNDFFDRKKVHKIEVICQNGDIYWEYDVNAVRLFSGAAKKCKIIKYRFKTNDMYMDEIRYFLSCLKNGISDKGLDIHDGLATLKLALRIKN